VLMMGVKRLFSALMYKLCIEAYIPDLNPTWFYFPLESLAVTLNRYMHDINIEKL